MYDKPTKKNFKTFLEEMHKSEKAEALGSVSYKDYYQFLTGRKPLTKTFKETKQFIIWKTTVWRPFSKTLTASDWADFGVHPSIGRDGMIAVFSYEKTGKIT